MAHIANLPIAEGRNGHHLLLHARKGQGDLPGKHLEFDNPGGVEIHFHSIPDPGFQQRVIIRIGPCSHPAYVWHGTGDLHQEEALVRSGPVEAAPFEVVGKSNVIEQWVIPSQGELKSILTLLRPVADA